MHALNVVNTDAGCFCVWTGRVITALSKTETDVDDAQHFSTAVVYPTDWPTLHMSVAEPRLTRYLRDKMAFSSWLSLTAQKLSWNSRVISADIEVAWVHLRQLVLVICILSFGERFLDEALASWTEAGVSVAWLDSLTAYTCSILHCLCWSLVTDDLYKYTVSTLHTLAFWLPALCSHAKAFLSF